MPLENGTLCAAGPRPDAAVDRAKTAHFAAPPRGTPFAMSRSGSPLRAEQNDGCLPPALRLWLPPQPLREGGAVGVAGLLLRIGVRALRAVQARRRRP